MDRDYRRFWHRTDADRIALLDPAGRQSLSYADLAAEVSQLAVCLDGHGMLAFLSFRNDVASVIAYLACVEAGVAVALIDPAQGKEVFTNLREIYRPDIVLGSDPTWFETSVWHKIPHTSSLAPAALVRGHIGDPGPHRDLSVLLSTSGSTGSPKLVKLSYAALASNAASISRGLAIDADDRAITTLPLHYSYGLSILNSHLASGAVTVITDQSPMTSGFWDLFRSAECTSLAGVPYSYAMYDRLNLASMGLTTLRVMTQAGGRLPVEATQRYWEFMDRTGGRFYTMYGQTEATARITILPHERGNDKLGSVGPAIHGGEITISDADPGEVHSRPTGEVVYTGENVMMGYATCRDDLAAGDEMKGRLATGDIGNVDDEGYLFITGRSKRIGKVFGIRVNLDEVETIVSREGRAAVVARDDHIVVFLESDDPDVPAKERARNLANILKVHFSGIEVRYVTSLPATSSGKVDYRSLLEMA